MNFFGSYDPLRQRKERNISHSIARLVATMSIGFNVSFREKISRKLMTSTSYKLIINSYLQVSIKRVTVHSRAVR